MLNLVVEGSHVTVIDNLRKLQKTLEETKMMFAGRAHLDYQTTEASTQESECMHILFGNLSVQLRDKIIEQSNLESL